MAHFLSRRALCAGCTLVLVLTSAVATAHDLIPPPWQRTHPRATYAEWVFPTPNTTVSPVPLPLVVGDYVAGGPPVARIGHGVGPLADPITGDLPFTDLMWDITGQSWGGMGTSGGMIELYVPNWIDNEPFKLIQVQMTYIGVPGMPQGSPGSYPYIYDAYGFWMDDPDTGLPRNSEQLSSLYWEQQFPVSLIDGIWQHVQRWRIEPNPDWEFIYIHLPSDVALFQIVVDTISVPEPSAGLLAIVGAACAALAMRRRRAARG